MQRGRGRAACLPLSFDYGLYQMLLASRVGGDARAREGLRLPGQVVEAARERGRHRLARRADACSACCSACAASRRRELPALRYLSNTAAALLGARRSPACARPSRRRRIYSMYGLTECKRCSYLPPRPDRRQAGLGRHRDPRHRGLGRGRRGQRVRPGRGRRAGGARPARHAGLLERRRGHGQAPPPRPLALGARAADRRPLQARRRGLPLLRRAARTT